MITSYLPSKLIRPTGLLVASALLAFSTTAATATDTSALKQLNAYLATSAGGSTTVAAATVAQLEAALEWTGTAKSTGTPKNTYALNATNAIGYAQAVQTNANYLTNAPALLSALVQGAKGTATANTSVAAVGAMVNVFLTGSGSSLTLSSANALLVVDAGLQAPILASGASAPNLFAFIKAIWTPTTKAPWDTGNTSAGSHDALGQITNQAVAAGANLLTKETVVVDVITPNPTAAVDVMYNLATASMGTDVGTFGNYVVSKCPTAAGSILMGIAFANAGSPSLPAITTQVLEGSIANAPKMSGSLASISTMQSADGIALCLVNAYAAKSTALSPLVVEGLAKAIPTTPTTLTGSSAGEAMANETAAVAYTTGTYASSGLTGTKLKSAVSLLLGDLLGSLGARIKTVAAPSATQAAEITAYYQWLAGDLTKLIKTLDNADATALEAIVKTDLNASIGYSMTGAGTTGLTGYVAVAKGYVAAAITGDGNTYQAPGQGTSTAVSAILPTSGL